MCTETQLQRTDNCSENRERSWAALDVNSTREHIRHETVSCAFTHNLELRPRIQVNVGTLSCALSKAHPKLDIPSYCQFQDQMVPVNLGGQHSASLYQVTSTALKPSFKLPGMIFIYSNFRGPNKHNLCTVVRLYCGDSIHLRLLTPAV
jgi:hypothetical protein